MVGGEGLNVCERPRFMRSEGWRNYKVMRTYVVRPATPPNLPFYKQLMAVLKEFARNFGGVYFYDDPSCAVEKSSIIKIRLTI